LHGSWVNGKAPPSTFPVTAVGADPLDEMYLCRRGKIKQLQQSVVELGKLGRIPPSNSADREDIRQYQNLSAAIQKPVTGQEARLLVTLFGPDDCFGLAWTVVASS
jgi:hypothetical protein